VLTRLGFDLQRAGRQLKTTCPFHDDAHPSLTVNVDRNAWYCWPCGRGGDALRFVMDYQGITFAEAVREVASC
jgi:DNA primase